MVHGERDIWFSSPAAEASVAIVCPQLFPLRWCNRPAYILFAGKTICCVDGVTSKITLTIGFHPLSMLIAVRLVVPPISFRMLLAIHPYGLSRALAIVLAVHTRPFRIPLAVLFIIGFVVFAIALSIISTPCSPCFVYLLTMRCSICSTILALAHPTVILQIISRTPRTVESTVAFDLSTNNTLLARAITRSNNMLKHNYPQR